jgi:hypothetical protein
MRKILQLLFVSSLIFTLWSFQIPKEINRSTIPPKVAKKIDAEIADYYYERRKACELDALVRAEDYVDSILVNKINIDVLKGISFPKKPNRPQSPSEIKLDDTTVVRPILK